ncbi:MAG: threonine synthase [bacterium]
MGKLNGLICKECGAMYDTQPIHYCEECFGPLEVAYNYDWIKTVISRKRIAFGPLSLWRYHDLLPVESNDVVTLQEGFTPLIKARRLGPEIGLENLFIKNDAVNPTYSFKDRVVTVAATKAREFGFDNIACPSTGNLACAVSAYAAVAGMKAFVFIPADLELGKIIGASIYRPFLVRVNGSYDDVNRLCSEVSERFKWAFVNINIRPYYAEGSKTLGYEVAEQLGWRAPDHVVVPMASGSLLTKIHKGLMEFQQLGLIEPHPVRVSGAQGEGCCPIVTAFKEKTDIIKPVKPNTIAKSLAIGNPADGYYAWKVINETGGSAEAATDEEIVEGIELLARTEGIFTETAGGVTIAVLKKLARQGVIHKNEFTVAYITGNGLKTMEAVADCVVPSEAISPTIEEFDESLIELWLTSR